MRRIDSLIVHCAATMPHQDIGASEIDQWHRDRGWDSGGYHYVIRRNGKLEIGRPVEVVGAHVAGHNSHSIGICLIGGIDTDGQPEANFTFPQYERLIRLLSTLETDYPDAVIMGHRDVAGVKKECPCFDVKSFINWTTGDEQ